MEQQLDEFGMLTLALVLLVGPSMLEGMSGWWEILAILAGLVVLAGFNIDQQQSGALVAGKQ